MSLAVTLYRNRLVLALALLVCALYILLVRPARNVDTASLSYEGLTSLQREGNNQRWAAIFGRGGGGRPAARFVQTALRENRVVLFSKTTCPYCKAAKLLLEHYREQYGLRFLVVEADKRGDSMEIKKVLASLCQHRTFPSIFVDAKCIGGNVDIQRLDKSGALAQMLTERGIIGARRNLPLPGFSQAVELSGGAFVEAFIAKFGVAVFGKGSCPYSSSLKLLLNNYTSVYGLEHHWVDVEQRTDASQVRAELARVSGLETLPNMFVNFTSLGGFSDVQAKHTSGELQRVLLNTGHLSKAKLAEHMDELVKEVNQLIAANYVVVYGQASETGAAQAAAILQSYRGKHDSPAYTFVDIGERVDHLQAVEAIREVSGRPSLPAVFVDGNEVGGLAGLRRLHKTGELSMKLAAAKPTGLKAEEQSAAEQKVRQLVKRNRVMLFSKTYCPYSRRAKRLLAEYKSKHGLDFSVLEVDLEADPMEVKAALGKVSGLLTFPNVFIDGLSIGGSDDLQAKHESGELARLLKKAGLLA
ncbi:hypothetical protein GGI04_000524 [Coemansia thaxteri]|nr:hypothetical protein GGI04_000524 [Coemansia thaxteri]